ncbi:hypothetical protein BCCGELA001_17475 [Bradyrhizobium sp. CCGE-LA001]|nr:hypothetical protein BCCGELA001_17475 [Bradyrhizobium sp. CCGE-LA001]KYG99895.1 hypothetical protein SE91_16555 [Bradyrhizobium sp. DOA1]
MALFHMLERILQGATILRSAGDLFRFRRWPQRDAMLPSADTDGCFATSERRSDLFGAAAGLGRRLACALGAWQSYVLLEAGLGAVRHGVAATYD